MGGPEMSDTVAKCPVCGADIDWEEDYEEGEAVDCEQCGAALVIESIEPVTLTAEDDDDLPDDLDDNEDEDDDDDFEDDDDYEDDDED